MLLTQQMTQAEIQNKTVNLHRDFKLWPSRVAQWPVSEMCSCIMPQRVSWLSWVCHEAWSLLVTSDCLSLATTWKGNCCLVNRNISQIWRGTFHRELTQMWMLQISLLSWRSFRDVTYPDIDLDCIPDIIRMHSEIQHPHSDGPRVRKWRQEVDPWP